jgi:hypothetical protein
MQMVKRSASIVVAVWLAIILFMPKSELYYTLEKKLSEKDITLNEQRIDEGLFSLVVEDITVYVKGIPLASIDKMDFFTLLFYSSITIDRVELDEVLHTKAPKLTKELKATHMIFTPTSLSLDANGTFGTVEGDVDLLDKKVHIDFIETGDIDTIRSYLTKGETGWFYEKSF